MVIKILENIIMKYASLCSITCYSGDTGSKGPVGEPGIKGTKGNHGDIRSYIRWDSLILLSKRIKGRYWIYRNKRRNRTERRQR